MGLLDKWVLKRAAKIQEKEKAEKEASEKRWKEQWEYSAKVRKEAKEVLTKMLEPLIASMESKEEHIKPGDNAVLNRYELVRKCFNGWDGGPGSFLNHCDPEDKSTPVMVKIESIYVDTSLAHEKIDKWLENQDSFMLGTAKPEKIIEYYTNWLLHLNPSNEFWRDSKMFGLYKTAMFTPQHTKFVPKWGLNINSFLEENTLEAKETKEVWLEEASLEFARKSIQENLKKLEDRRKELSAKYHSISYL